MKKLLFVFLLTWIAVTAHVIDRALAQEVRSIDVNYADGRVARFLPAPKDSRPVYVISPGDPIPLGSDRHIVFRKGQVYEVKASLFVGFANLALEAEADTPREQRPVIRFVNVPPAPVWAGILECNENTLNFTLANLVLDSAAPDLQGAKPRGIQMAGKNLTLTNVTGRYLGDFINMERRPDGVLIKDCDCPLAKSIWGYGIWMDGSNITIDHFVFVNSIREHAIRGRGTHIIIRNCDLSNTFDPADPADFSKATIRIMAADDVLIEDDLLGPGDYQVGTNTDEVGVANNVRINRVTLRGGAGFHYGSTPVPPGGATHVVIDGQPVQPTKWN